MDLFPDFKDLLAAFVASGAKFVIIGGYAVIFHGRPRATKDIDIFVAVDPENRSRVADALATFGAAPNIVEAARNLQTSEVVFFGISPLRVDILGSASGVEFSDVFSRAEQTTLDGVPVRIIALDDLLANKRASGRVRDLEDVEELERIAARRRSP